MKTQTYLSSFFFLLMLATAITTQTAKSIASPSQSAPVNSSAASKLVAPALNLTSLDGKKFEVTSLCGTYGEGTGNLALPIHLVIDQEGNIATKLIGSLIKTDGSTKSLDDLANVTRRLVKKSPDKTTEQPNEKAARARQTAYPLIGKLVDIGGYRLHLHCIGRRSPTVVLLSGAGDFSFDWSLTQSSISRFARVCSYDRAGFAWSDPGPTPRTMKQEAYELHKLLKAARIHTPAILVGHSLGGLIARVYAEQFPNEVAGMVLVDATHEDTTLLYQGKLVRVRDGATGKPIPPVQTMQSSPPKPPTAEDIEQFEFNQKIFGKPKTEAPCDKLPASVQAMRLWFRSQPPSAAAGTDFWAEELQAMYLARAKTPYQLGAIPLAVLITKPGGGNPPPGIADDEWQRVMEEKRQQKVELTNLSQNSKLIVAEKSGHHIQLDEPQLVTNSIRQVVEAVRQHTKLVP